MAQGDVLQIDDKIQIDGDGKIRLVDADSDCPDCCGCTPSAASCTHCYDVTPSQYQVTFSGVTDCGCHNGVDVDYRQITYNTNLNDTFTLSQGSAACQWSITLTNAITSQDYSSDATCTTTYGPPVDSDIIITLTKLGTTWTLTVQNDFGRRYTFFSDTQTATIDGAGDQVCATVPAFANDYKSDGTGTHECGDRDGAINVAAEDGTATVVCA